MPIKLLCNFIEMKLSHGYSPENLLHIFKTIFYNNTPEGMLLLVAHGELFKTLSNICDGTICVNN